MNTVHLSPYFGSSIPTPAANIGQYESGRQLGGAIYTWNTGLYGGTNNGGIGLYHQGSGDCPAIGGITIRSWAAYGDGSGLWCGYSMD